MSHIEALKLQLGSWQKVQIPRECNDVADALAKFDVFRRNVLLVKYDEILPLILIDGLVHCLV